MCLCVFVFLQRQEQEARGEDEKHGEDFAAYREKTRAGIRAAACAFGIHNAPTVTHCHTKHKKKVSLGANFFCPYFLTGFAV